MRLAQVLLCLLVDKGPDCTVAEHMRCDYLQSSEADGNEEQQEGLSSKPAKKRGPPEQAKKAAKKRKLVDGMQFTHRSEEAAWPVLAEGAGMLVGILKSAGWHPYLLSVSLAFEALRPFIALLLWW